MSRPIVLSVFFFILFPYCHASDGEVRGIIAEAEAAYRAGIYDNCLKLYDEAIGAESQPNQIYYNAACCAALSGKENTALDYLAYIAANDYKDVDFIKADSDLAVLHSDPHWNDIIKQVELNLKDYLDRINIELYNMFKEDQRLRNLPEDSVDWNVVADTDRKHRERTMQILADHGLKHPDDYFHAALIFQHGTNSSDYRMAHELAKSGLTLDPDHSGLRWMFAVTKDRWLWSVGKAQIYGTQSTIRDGRWTLEPLDTLAVTDEDRAALGLPSLEYYMNRVEALNGK